MKYKMKYKISFQLPTYAIVQLLNRPYENGVILRGQNMPSKCCQPLIFCILLAPILGGGEGHYGPDDHKQPCCFRRIRATVTKIHDFVSVSVWIVPWKLVLGFVFKIFEKKKKFGDFNIKGSPFGKKFLKIKKIILVLFEFLLYMF